MRLFVAVRPSVEALAHLGSALGRPPEPTWHVTLAFLGEAPVPSLAPVAAGHAPFRLSLAGSGRFGRAVWVGVAGDVAALGLLARGVREACGLPDQRPYRPHLTVSRGRLDLSALSAYAGPSFDVDRLLLVQSVLGQRAVHTVLEEHRLTGGSW